MTNPVDHVTMVDVDTAGTAGFSPVPAVRHLPVHVPTAELERPTTTSSSTATARPIDRFTAGAGVLIAALGALLYALSLDCGDEPAATLAVIVGTGGASLTIWALIPGLTILERAGRIAALPLRPICWAATVAPRRAAAATWLVLVAVSLAVIASKGAQPC